MYEKCTDRARKVIQLANQEAQRFNHQYIGTEHVLLGLIKEGSGVGACVLKNLGADLRKIRLEVERLVQCGFDPVTRGKLPPTPRAKKVIEYSIDEARNLNHNYVGTEHIVLGLLREQEAVAAQALMNLGLNLEEVREEILNLLAHGMRSTPKQAERLTEVEDVPESLKARLADLDADIRRFTREKEEAVANMDFEQAASCRDEAFKRQRERQALMREWFTSHPADPAWLAANGGIGRALAETIKAGQSWNLLHYLADALEAAGCGDTEILNHCRSGVRHSGQCWVVELLLSAPDNPTEA